MSVLFDIRMVENLRHFVLNFDVPKKVMGEKSEDHLMTFVGLYRSQFSAIKTKRQLLSKKADAVETLFCKVARKVNDIADEAKSFTSVTKDLEKQAEGFESLGKRCKSVLDAAEKLEKALDLVSIQLCTAESNRLAEKLANERVVILKKQELAEQKLLKELEQREEVERNRVRAMISASEEKKKAEEAQKKKEKTTESEKEQKTEKEGKDSVLEKAEIEETKEEQTEKKEEEKPTETKTEEPAPVEEKKEEEKKPEETKEPEKTDEKKPDQEQKPEGDK